MLQLDQVLGDVVYKLCSPKVFKSPSFISNQICASVAQALVSAKLLDAI